uniref:GG19737 n=1 Tax=Drosophila erecta TaxID=7220 RepID=B3P439_DROER
MQFERTPETTDETVKAERQQTQQQQHQQQQQRPDSSNNKWNNNRHNNMPSSCSSTSIYISTICIEMPFSHAESCLRNSRVSDSAKLAS